MDNVKIMNDIPHETGQVWNLRKHKPEKGSRKGLGEGSEREKCDVEIGIFSLTSYSVRKHNNEKDFVQILPFYFQVYSCWIF